MVIKADRDDRLDRILAQARGTTPSDDLVARVLADAARVQEDAAAQVQPSAAPTAPRGRRFRPAWVSAIGGWGGVSGVTLAGVVGLVIGFAMPDTIDVLSGGQIWSLSGGGGVTPDLSSLAWEEGGDV
ncbi:hypothetical protein roselon_00039 [Roseibacterium elongatum DSM 19469]|uniref:Dihydroorotate dehydrogenase n=1 Tax=Roseicyclus elongatus DSM 19469 TaxID=1294273 RepID=W8S1B6_9RHOB|nr:hypothetical protein [Roseibacterium elongatum]AHM02506.1 hypothetical protein roselon_00039 [Roseibacterium elongatum DSM 19469]